MIEQPNVRLRDIRHSFASILVSGDIEADGVGKRRGVGDIGGVWFAPAP